MVITIGAIILFVGAEPIIAIFRDNPDVLAVGVRALRLQAVAILALPVSVACEMLYQSCGHRGGATLLSGIRNGILKLLVKAELFPAIEIHFLLMDLAESFHSAL